MRLLLVLLVFLGGCNTLNLRAERDHRECLGYGFSEGTPEYTQCRMLTAQQRRAATSAGLSALGAALINSQPQAQPRPVVTCSTFGTMTTCH